MARDRHDSGREEAITLDRSFVRILPTEEELREAVQRASEFQDAQPRLCRADLPITRPSSRDEAS